MPASQRSSRRPTFLSSPFICSSSLDSRPSSLLIRSCRAIRKESPTDHRRHFGGSGPRPSTPSASAISRQLGPLSYSSGPSVPPLPRAWPHAATIPPFSAGRTACCCSTRWPTMLIQINGMRVLLTGCSINNRLSLLPFSTPHSHANQPADQALVLYMHSQLRSFPHLTPVEPKVLFNPRGWIHEASCL